VPPKTTNHRSGENDRAANRLKDLETQVATRQYAPIDRSRNMVSIRAGYPFG